MKRIVETNAEERASDYAQMRLMIFGDYPKWDEILGKLQTLEKQINGTTP